MWGPIIGAIVFQFITEKTGDWADHQKIPSVLRPLFSWADVAPASGIFALTLIVLMFVAPLGIAGLWKRVIGHIVTVVPKPAGSGTVDASEAPPVAMPTWQQT